MLVQKYHDTNSTDKLIIADVERALKSSYELRNKRDLINRFIDSLKSSEDITADWKKYINKEKEKELLKIIEEEKLDENATRKFVARAFAEGEVSDTGTAITKLMTVKPSRFGRGNNYADMKMRIVDRLKKFFERFKGLVSND